MSPKQSEGLTPEQKALWEKIKLDMARENAERGQILSKIAGPQYHRELGTGILEVPETGRYIAYRRRRALGAFATEHDAAAAIKRAQSRAHTRMVITLGFILPIIFAVTIKYWSPVMWYLQTGFWYNP